LHTRAFSFIESVPMPSPLSSGHRFAVLALRLSAVLAAAGAQSMVRTRPWLSMAGFAAGMLLYIVAERLVPTAPEPDVPAAAPVPLGFWWLFCAGTALCVAAGALVFRNAAPGTTQPIWGIGLLLLVAAALWSWLGRRSRQRLSPRVIAAAIFFLILSAAFFAAHVSTMPPEVHNDEAEVGYDAIHLVLDRSFDVFTIGWYELPMLHAFPAAVGVKLFGINLLGLRIPSVVLGTASVVLIFAVAYRLWGFEAALASGLLLVSARFFVHLSRTGYHYIQTPFLSVLAVWLFVQAWYDLSLTAAVWCGVALGLGIQGYYASRLVPVLLVLTWLLWLPGSEPTLRRARIGRFLVIVVTALATAAPMIGFFSHNWNALWARTRGTSVFGEDAFRHLSFGYHTNSLAEILRIQAAKAVTLFNLTGDSSLQYGFVSGGLLEPVSAALFVLGLAVICARPLQRRNLMVLLWVLIPVVVGGALTIDTPFYPRIGGTVPFAALLGGVALHRLLSSIRQAFPAATGRIGAALVAAGVLAAVGTNNVESYFIDYAPHHRHSSAVEISAWIQAHGHGKTTYMVGGAPGFFITHGTIRFLAHGYATADIVDLDNFLHGHHLDPSTSVFIIMPQGHDLIPKLEAAVGPLDVDEHRTIRNDVGFYGGIPRVAEAGHAGT
jgi:4-amino-4-deoxy-L-arabinose transferase-like glycosyltransferase